MKDVSSGETGLNIALDVVVWARFVVSFDGSFSTTLPQFVALVAMESG